MSLACMRCTGLVAGLSAQGPAARRGIRQPLRMAASPARRAAGLPGMGRRPSAGRLAAGRSPGAARRPSPLCRAVDVEIEEDGGGGGGGDNIGDGFDRWGDDGDEGGVPPEALNLGLVGSLAVGFRRRIEADPNFVFKIAAECMNDTLICLAVNYAARGERFIHELEFVICHVATSVLNDVCLVTLLAPVAGAATIPKSGVAATMARLPSHMFQQGAFSLSQRAACFAFKGALYSGIGFGMGILGSATVMGLSKARSKMDPAFKAPPSPPLLMNGFAWMGFMGLSSNTRYQTVNGIERVLFRALPGGPARSASWAIRLGNNFLGGANFVWWSKLIGMDAKGNKGYGEHEQDIVAA